MDVKVDKRHKTLNFLKQKVYVNNNNLAPPLAPFRVKGRERKRLVGRWFPKWTYDEAYTACCEYAGCDDGQQIYYSTLVLSFFKF
jgi:hypothetical protein